MIFRANKMTESCLHTVRGRQCQMKAVKDGYCTRHHPETIEAKVADASQYDLVKGAREIEQREEALVGVFMRMRRREEFDSVLKEIKDADMLANQMRHLR